MFEQSSHFVISAKHPLSVCEKSTALSHFEQVESSVIPHFEQLTVFMLFIIKSCYLFINYFLNNKIENKLSLLMIIIIKINNKIYLLNIKRRLQLECIQNNT